MAAKKDTTTALPAMDPQKKAALLRAARGETTGDAAAVPMGIRYHTATTVRPAPVDQRPLWMTLADPAQLVEIASVTPRRGSVRRRSAAAPTDRAPRPAAAPTVRITSFGYGHAGAPAGSALVVDVRNSLRNPHDDPAMRELTGLDPRVAEHVLSAPGAQVLVDDTIGQVLRGEATDVAVGCVGGRHRSVALANAIADGLIDAGRRVNVVHRDVTQPLLPGSGPATPVDVDAAEPEIVDSPRPPVVRRFDAYACEMCGSRYRYDDADHDCGQLTPVTVTIGPAAPTGQVLGSYDAYACPACGDRWGHDMPDHGCGPLTLITVTITARAGEQA